MIVVMIIIERKTVSRIIGKKALNMITGIMLLICMFFSVLFIVAEAGHECHDEDCAICACIQLCEKQLDQIGTGIIAAICAFIFIRVLYSVSLYTAVYPTAFLTEHKVRLNI